MTWPCGMPRTDLPKRAAEERAAAWAQHQKTCRTCGEVPF